MKITFVLPKLDMSGGVISTIELSNILSLRGHDVNIVYPSFSLGPRLKWYNIRSIWENLKKSKKIKYKLFNRVPIKCNLVHVPTLNKRYIPNANVIIATWWETAYYINSYSITKGVKFYFVRGYEIWYGNKAMVDKTYSFPLHIITTSNYLKKLLTDQFGISVVGIVPNGVNFNLFYKNERSSKNQKFKRIGMVYRTQKWKGMRDGFEAFAFVKKKYPYIKLVLFGGPRGDDIPSDAEFHKYKQIDELRELYNSLDIFMLPSHEEEGFSNPPLEAMACGVACVLTNVGGVPDYTIPGKTALVSPPHDSKALADNLLCLLMDDERRNNIAEAGYKYIRRFSWEKSASQLETILENNLHKSKKL